MRYQILRPHARGGLGEVFVALDRELGREIALKEIRDRHADDPQFRRRFFLEAGITGRLEHPGVVPVYGLGRYADGRPYYAMRLIRGESLRQAVERIQPAGCDPVGNLREQCMARRKLIGCLVDVCNTVAYAHGQGVLHRDLKPENILIGPYDETLVVDWGLARLIGRSEPEAGPGTKMATVDGSSHTQAGSVVGTPAYMSPEQASGATDRLGPASDIYSLGAILYCLLVGRDPILDGDLAAVLRRAQKGDFPRPRSVVREVPVALEAVCLKAMSLAPEDRYASARELAADLELWLAGEPVSAYAEPWSTRVWRWSVRHRTLVTMLGAAVLVLLVVGAGALARRVAVVNGLVDTLATAEIDEIPSILERLVPDRRWVLGRLRALAAPAERDDGRRLRGALALLGDDPEQVDYLAGRLTRPDTEPEETAVVCEVLAGDRRHAGPVISRLWAALAEATRGLSETQFRAAAALARLDPADGRWPDLGRRVAPELVLKDSSRVGRWRKVFQPARDALLRPLLDLHALRDRPERWSTAFDLLYDLITQLEYPGQIEDLAELITVAEPQQFDRIRGRLAKPEDRRRATDHLIATLRQPPRPDDEGARRRGRAAAALVALGRPQPAWPHLRSGLNPGERTELMLLLAPFGADPLELIARLVREEDVSARRALVLALGEFPATALPAGPRAEVTAWLLRAFVDDPDPGLHSAIDWLLRQRWGLAEELDRRRTPAGSARARGWLVDAKGRTMVVVRGPVSFVMGSPEGEPDRRPDETRHRVTIDRSFAVAALEVTRAQFATFLDEDPELDRFDRRKEVLQYIPTPDCPVVWVDWDDAARYCNWLSRSEGIPEDEWCYVAGKGTEMIPAPDALTRTGYRLPTEAEWEYACRAGTATSRPQGGSTETLPRFGWSIQNAGDQAHPVGQLRPNDMGFFDMLGNAFEWTHDPRPGSHSSGPHAVAERALRGGSFFVPPSFLRSASRNWFAKVDRDFTFGFRVARTIR
ncbi:MAG: bifunctional serine/threonine-protein kinase/formylglycine-generating enzyme family protein [Isosphaeraceae bacterium]